MGKRVPGPFFLRGIDQVPTRAYPKLIRLAEVHEHHFAARQEPRPLAEAVPVGFRSLSG